MKNTNYTCCEDCLCEYLDGESNFCSKTQRVCPFQEAADLPQQKKPSHQRKNKYFRNKVNRRKLSKKAKLYIYGVYLCENKKDKYGEAIPYFRKYYKGEALKYCKKVSAKKMRAFHGYIPNGNCYRKMFLDFWMYLD